MQKIEIRLIGTEDAPDIKIKNEPFKLWGRMLPAYQDGKWTYSVSESGQAGWDIFPDEDYDYAAMKGDQKPARAAPRKKKRRDIAILPPVGC